MMPWWPSVSRDRYQAAVASGSTPWMSSLAAALAKVARGYAHHVSVL